MGLQAIEPFRPLSGQRAILVPFNVLNSRAAPDGTFFVYLDSSFILYAADVFGLQQQLTTNAVKPDQIASFSIGFSPNSAYFVFVDSQLTKALYSVPSRGSGPVVRLSSPTQTQALTGVSISPDSLWVAYIHTSSLFVSSIATGSNMAIASPAFLFLWSRDSLHCLYECVIELCHFQCVCWWHEPCATRISSRHRFTCDLHPGQLTCDCLGKL